MLFDKVSKLERLHKLKELGVLDEAQFEERKKLILEAKPVSKWLFIVPALAILGAGGAYGGVTYKAHLDAEKRKQQEAELPIPMVSYKKETKVVWEFTVGSNATPSYNYFYGYTDNSAAVSQACAYANTDIAREEANGWKIKSFNPAEKYVTNGTCKGRDVMLEREAAVITMG
jgi:hypothetical protein